MAVDDSARPNGKEARTAPLYAELRQLLSEVRWLRRGALALLVFDIAAAVLLWIVQDPGRMGL